MNLRIRRGEFVCILGGNGSGKSTIAKLADALLAPDEGRVRVMGEDTSDPAVTYLVRSSAGLVFQNPDDQIVSSVIENDVAFGPENLGVEQENLREVVTRSLAAVGLAGCEKARDRNVVGGSEAARRHRGRAGHGSGYPHPGRGDRDARPRRQRSRDEHMREASRARDDRGHDHALHGRGGARRPGRRHRPGEIALDGTPEDILTGPTSS